MTATHDVDIVLMGPAVVRGPHAVPADLATEALADIDDELALVDERVVSVDALLREVLQSALGSSDAPVLLVGPSWWSRHRVDRVRDAVERPASRVTVLRRAEVLCDGSLPDVVEIAPEFVGVHRRDAAPALVARAGDPHDTADAVLDLLRDAAVVTVDVPAGIPGAHEVGIEVARRLRARGVAVTVIDDDAVVVAARAEWVRRRTGARNPRLSMVRLGPFRVAVVCVASSVAGLACAGMWPDPDHVEPSLTWLVEGRVAIEVPAQWITERVEVGPGSARVQVVSPVDARAAVHLTQSQIPVGQSLDAAADVVRAALGEQPGGVFGGFDAAARVADRPAITYRETRSDRHVDWTLMLDDGIRIAIGCQGAPDLPAPHDVCEHVIRSAHAWD